MKQSVELFLLNTVQVIIECIFSMLYKFLQSSFFLRKFFLALVLTGLICLFSTNSLSAQNCNTPTNIRTVTKGKDFIDLRWNHDLANLDHFQIKLIHKTSVPDTIIFESDLNIFTIYDLAPGQQYEVEIRAVCTMGITNLSRYQFTTVLDNEASCGLHLDIIERGNFCELNPQFFDIEVTNVPGNQLGVDIDFSSIELIIPHPTPSDLNFSLISPSGKMVLLSQSNGLARQNYGNPEAQNCALPIVFTPLACNSIVGLSGPLTGAVLPQESFITFQDSTNPNGIWKLRICDDFIGDPGFLQYVKINFSNDACTPSPDVYFTKINAEEIAVSIANFSQCDSVIVELVPAGKSPGFGLNKGDPENLLVHMPCGINPYLISGLLPNQEYTLYNRTQCPGDRFSFNSCGLTFSTLCQHADIQSGFDNLEECSDDCIEACTLDNIWSNQTDSGLKWLVKSGSTDTDLTGPNGDLFGRGKYIYVEASDPECLNTGPAEIISECLHWAPTDTDCNLSFNYHMNGPESGSLKLLITKDGGFNWAAIWELEGDQGDQWHRVNIDLVEYIGQNVQLKFSALPEGSLGDVALDEISLLGNVSIVTEETVFYADQDDDGFGNPSDSISVCALFPPETYVDNNLDCNDNDPMINPNATEIPCNLIDDNCNGQIDDVIGGLNIASANIQDATCNGVDDGKISLVIEGGLPPYDISWSNSFQNTNILSDLAPGFYDVTITDQNDCESILTNMYVGLNTAFLITLDNVIPASCSGIEDGSLSISLSDQLPANSYTFIWSNGDTIQNLSNITNGSYQVTVTNNDGCIELSPIFNVGSLSSLQLSLEDVENISCPGKNDGSIRLRATGGQSPYQYTWEHQAGNENMIMNLSPGTYSVTISDLQGCNTTRTYELNDPDSIDIRIRTLDPVTCPGAINGKIQIEVSGGNSPYSYTWNTWENEDTLVYYSKNILQARSGWYFLTVTDAGSCKKTMDSIYVGTPDPFELNNLVVYPNRCLSSMEGKIHFDLSGGTPEYVYLWSNGSVASGLDSLASGTYTLTINDQYNCKFVAGPFHVLNEDRPLDLEVNEISDILCHSDTTGTIIVELKDGVSPFEFHWSNGRKVSKQISSDSILNLAQGAYRITITDSEGCLGINQNMVVSGPLNPLTYSVEEYKAPICHSSGDGYIRLIAMGGTEPYEFEWNTGTRGNILSGLTEGTFDCKITDANGCELDILPLQMMRPDSIVYGLSYDGRLCADNLGTAAINVQGGIAPYDIHWTHNSFTGMGASINNAPCGFYSIAVMDNAGCVMNIEFLLDMTIATENEETGTSYKLYPVPANDWIFLESNNNEIQAGPFHIYNAQGMLVNLITSESIGILPIDISKLHPGYFRLVWNKNGKVFSLPFLVH